MLHLGALICYFAMNVAIKAHKFSKGVVLNDFILPLKENHLIAYFSISQPWPGEDLRTSTPRISKPTMLSGEILGIEV